MSQPNDDLRSQLLATNEQLKQLAKDLERSDAGLRDADRQQEIRHTEVTGDLKWHGQLIIGTFLIILAAAVALAWQNQGLIGQVENAAASVSNMEVSVDEHGKAVTDLKISVGILTERSTDAMDRLGKMNEQMAAVAQKLDANAAAVGDLQTAVSQNTDAAVAIGKFQRAGTSVITVRTPLTKETAIALDADAPSVPFLDFDLPSMPDINPANVSQTQVVLPSLPEALSDIGPLSASASIQESGRITVRLSASDGEKLGQIRKFLQGDGKLTVDLLVAMRR
jgi:uncharacterized protein YoxC